MALPPSSLLTAAATTAAASWKTSDRYASVALHGSSSRGVVAGALLDVDVVDDLCSHVEMLLETPSGAFATHGASLEHAAAALAGIPRVVGEPPELARAVREASSAPCAHRDVRMVRYMVLMSLCHLHGAGRAAAVATVRTALSLGLALMHAAQLSPPADDDIVDAATGLAASPQAATRGNSGGGGGICRTPNVPGSPLCRGRPGSTSPRQWGNIDSEARSNSGGPPPTMSPELRVPVGVDDSLSLAGSFLFGAFVLRRVLIDYAPAGDDRALRSLRGSLLSAAIRAMEPLAAAGDTFSSVCAQSNNEIAFIEAMLAYEDAQSQLARGSAVHAVEALIEAASRFKLAGRFAPLALSCLYEIARLLLVHRFSLAQVPGIRWITGLVQAPDVAKTTARTNFARDPVACAAANTAVAIELLSYCAREHEAGTHAPGRQPARFNWGHGGDGGTDGGSRRHVYLGRRALLSIEQSFEMATPLPLSLPAVHADLCTALHRVGRWSDAVGVLLRAPSPAWRAPLPPRAVSDGGGGDGVPITTVDVVTATVAVLNQVASRMEGVSAAVLRAACEREAGGGTHGSIGGDNADMASGAKTSLAAAGVGACAHVLLDMLRLLDACIATTYDGPQLALEPDGTAGHVSSRSPTLLPLAVRVCVPVLGPVGAAVGDSSADARSPPGATPPAVDALQWEDGLAGDTSTACAGCAPGRAYLPFDLRVLVMLSVRVLETLGDVAAVGLNLRAARHCYGWAFYCAKQVTGGDAGMASPPAGGLVPRCLGHAVAPSPHATRLLQKYTRTSIAAGVPAACLRACAYGLVALQRQHDAVAGDGTLPPAVEVPHAARCLMQAYRCIAPTASLDDFTVLLSLGPTVAASLIADVTSPADRTIFDILAVQSVAAVAAAEPGAAAAVAEPQLPLAALAAAGASHTTPARVPPSHFLPGTAPPASAASRLPAASAAANSDGDVTSAQISAAAADGAALDLASPGLVFVWDGDTLRVEASPDAAPPLPSSPATLLLPSSTLTSADALAASASATTRDTPAPAARPSLPPLTVPALPDSVSNSLADPAAVIASWFGATQARSDASMYALLWVGQLAAPFCGSLDADAEIPWHATAPRAVEAIVEALYKGVQAAATAAAATTASTHAAIADGLTAGLLRALFTVDDSVHDGAAYPTAPTATSVLLQFLCPAFPAVAMTSAQQLAACASPAQRAWQTGAALCCLPTTPATPSLIPLFGLLLARLQLAYAFAVLRRLPGLRQAHAPLLSPRGGSGHVSQHAAGGGGIAVSSVSPQSPAARSGGVKSPTPRYGYSVRSSGGAGGGSPLLLSPAASVCGTFVTFASPPTEVPMSKSPRDSSFGGRSAWGATSRSASWSAASPSSRLHAADRGALLSALSRAVRAQHWLTSMLTAAGASSVLGAGGGTRDGIAAASADGVRALLSPTASRVFVGEAVDAAFDGVDSAQLDSHAARWIIDVLRAADPRRTTALSSTGPGRSVTQRTVGTPAGAL